MINTKLVESLVQIIHTLNASERLLLEEKLFFAASEPLTKQIQQLAQESGSLDFLYLEPDLYTLEDGEAI